MHILVGGHLLGLFATQDFLSNDLTDRGHLFLALSLDGSLDAYDLIIRGGPVNNDWLGNALGPIEMQINVQYEDSYEEPDIWAFGHPDPLSLIETPISISYGSELLSSFDIAAAWQSLSYLAEQIGATGLDYDLIHQNSNSVVGTLLGIIGFGPFQPGFEVPGGSTAYYPAVGQPLTGDWLTGGNISYTIRGGYTTILGTDGEFVELPLGDRLFALNSNPYQTFFVNLQEGDFVTTFAGNDELHDGNRRDTLEGGAGDDRYILLDDNAADIIIAGEGDDILEGGGAEDRIVLRIDILDQMYDDWVAGLQEASELGDFEYILEGENLLKPSERLGEDALTGGMPILGGFWDMAIDGIEGTPLATGSFYTNVGSNFFLPNALVYTYTVVDQFGETHEAMSTPFHYSFEMSDSDLVITFSYGEPDETEAESGETYGSHTITIRDFEDGDYGIHIYNPELGINPSVPIYEPYDSVEEPWIQVGVTEASAYTIVANPEQLAYINNNGELLTILPALDPATTGSVPQTPPVQTPTIEGTEIDDTITGNGRDELIRARGGNDAINSGGGNDRVDAGDGDDTVYLGTGADLLLGGLGLDLLFGEGGDDGIAGGEGNDQINGGTGHDLLFGDDGDDVLSGETGNDRLDGGAGADTLDGGGGGDELSGGEGADTLLGGTGIDELNGDGGNDTLWGGDGHDLLNGGEGDDVLHGEAGFDRINGGGGADLAYGGTGNDTLNGDTGDDTLHGDGGIDLINGGDGADTLHGGANVDTLNGGAGFDTLWGGDGYDVLDGGEGDDILIGEAGFDLIFGGSGADILLGGLGDDTLSGGDGADTIRGGNGHDRLTGGAGDDILFGGTGDDRFIFASGFGSDAIKDFGGNDVIVLDSSLAGFFEDAMAHTTQTEQGVRLQFGEDSLLLANIQIGAMSAGYFEFI